jgi:hypothetical protein
LQTRACVESQKNQWQGMWQLGLMEWPSIRVIPATDCWRNQIEPVNGTATGWDTPLSVKVSTELTVILTLMN